MLNLCLNVCGAYSCAYISECGGGEDGELGVGSTNPRYALGEATKAHLCSTKYASFVFLLCRYCDQDGPGPVWLCAEVALMVVIVVVVVMVRACGSYECRLANVGLRKTALWLEEMMMMGLCCL